MRVPGAARRASTSRLARGVMPRRQLALVARRVHHLDGLVDGEEPAGEGAVHHLGEAVLALPSRQVARTADEVVGTLLALHELGEIRRVGTAELLHVGLDAGL